MAKIEDNLMGGVEVVDVRHSGAHHKVKEGKLGTSLDGNFQLIEIFNKFYGMYVGIAYSYTNSWEEAEDIVGDVFCKFLSTEDPIQIHHSFKGYLAQSVKNRCIDLKRKEKYLFSGLDASSNKMASLYSDPLEFAVSTQLITQIKTSLKKLPKDRRKVFFLSRFKGLKNKEIANHLDISIKTVETQISRALRTLRVELDEYLSCA